MFVAKNPQELVCIINKLKKLEPYLKINFDKSGIMELTPGTLNIRESTFMGFPIVESYKYLGIIITANTTKLRKDLKSKIKKNIGHVTSNTIGLGIGLKCRV